MSRGVAFVTGASRGIGAATAVALADAGFDVVVTARTLVEGERHERGSREHDDRPLPGSLETTAAAVRARGARALPVRLDLLDPASLAAAADEAEARCGPIDLLVNNGIYQGPGTMQRVLELRPEDADKVVRGNLLSPLLLVQRLLPGMLARRRGAIVNVVSAAGASDPPAPTGEGGWGFAYAASKAALARMAGVLAVEHAGSGVAFFNVEPGFVITEALRQRDLHTEFEQRLKDVPPTVAAAVIAWLATSPEAGAWNGRTVSAPKLARELGLVSA